MIRLSLDEIYDFLHSYLSTSFTSHDHFAKEIIDFFFSWSIPWKSSCYPRRCDQPRREESEMVSNTTCRCAGFSKPAVKIDHFVASIILNTVSFHEKKALKKRFFQNTNFRRVLAAQLSPVGRGLLWLLRAVGFRYLHLRRREAKYSDYMWLRTVFRIICTIGMRKDS